MKFEFECVNVRLLWVQTGERQRSRAPQGENHRPLSGNGQRGECDRWTRTHPGAVPLSQIDLPHYKTSPPPSSASPPPAPTSSDQSIDPRTSRSVATLWSGPGQLLQWVIVISLCLDQSTLIQAERLQTWARGTTDYSHQQHICETTTVSVHNPEL